MSLDAELRHADANRVAEYFDSILGSTTGDEDADVSFLLGEQDFAYNRYPIFEVIRTKFEDAVPAMEANSMSKERILAILTGMDIMATTIAAYASSETPDSPTIG